MAEVEVEDEHLAQGLAGLSTFDVSVKSITRWRDFYEKSGLVYRPVDGGFAQNMPGSGGRTEGKSMDKEFRLLIAATLQ